MKHRSRSIFIESKIYTIYFTFTVKCTYLKLFWLFPTLYYETYNGISSINLNFKFNTMTLKKAAVKIKICVDLINHYCFYISYLLLYQCYFIIYYYLVIVKTIRLCQSFTFKSKYFQLSQRYTSIIFKLTFYNFLTTWTKMI